MWIQFDLDGIMILPVIKWEIEHELLTEELKGKLVHYYRNIISGKYKKYIRHEDSSEIMKILLSATTWLLVE